MGHNFKQKWNNSLTVSSLGQHNTNKNASPSKSELFASLVPHFLDSRDESKQDILQNALEPKGLIQTRS